MRVRRDLEQICHHNRFGDRSLTRQSTRVNEETKVVYVSLDDAALRVPSTGELI